MISLKSLTFILLLTAVAAPASAEVEFAVGEPAEGSTRSGIGQISGWAVSDRKIVSVEAFIDGASLGLVPYGGSRLDVAAAFPDYPDAEFSGWSMKWNYSLHEPGEHLLTIVITEDDSTQTTRDVAFSTTAFHSEFIADPDAVHTTDANVSSPEDGRLVLEGAEIEGESVDIELAWDKASQQFLIDRITYAEVPRVNQAPLADAGPDFEATVGEEVSVHGNGADPDGFVSSRSWSRISGATVSLQGADQWVTQFVAPEDPGEVRLRLTVTDNEGQSATDDVIITFVEAPPTPNQAPTADAGPDLSVETGAAVTVNGSGSDSDGEIVAWQWTQTSGVGVALSGTAFPDVSFTAPDTAGILAFRLTVTDDKGATDSDEVLVIVDEPAPEPPPNQAPTANAGPNRTVATGAAVSITGSGSDSDGQIVEWQWTRLSGAAVVLQGAAGPTVSFTAPGSAGSVTLRLTVTDDDGASGSDDVLVTVEAPAPNQAPTANAGPDQTVQQGEAVAISGSGTDPDGSIVGWAWTQVSGTSVSLSGASSKNVSFTAPGTDGDIRLRLTVTDDDGASDTDDVVITVQGEPTPDTTTGATLESMLDLINEARGQARNCGTESFSAKPPLSWDGGLAGAAMDHSMDMARNAYFSHTSIDGRTVSDRLYAVWPGRIVGENIAAGTLSMTDAEVVDLWLDSEGHCKLIMSSLFTHMGAGYGRNDENGYNLHHFWTLDFGG